MYAELASIGSARLKNQCSKQRIMVPRVLLKVHVILKGLTIRVATRAMIIEKDCWCMIIYSFTGTAS